jgi:hypothetical protein
MISQPMISYAMRQRGRGSGAEHSSFQSEGHRNSAGPARRVHVTTATSGHWPGRSVSTALQIQPLHSKPPTPGSYV